MDLLSDEILLIAGSPGLGKTTLAHIVAKQAGYNVIEINASDDRTADVLKEKIVDAIESKSVFGNKKPNLVILDEVDGVVGSGETGFIRTLVRMVQGGQSVRKEEADVHFDEGITQKGKNTRKGVKKGVMRPIICICNNLYVLMLQIALDDVLRYAPILRPLKEIAQVYTIRKPSATDLAKRLRSICAVEGLKVDSRALTLLCEKSDCDIRTCLNTLEFMHHKLRSGQLTDSNHRPTTPGLTPRQNVVTLDIIRNMNVGHKDTQKSLFSIWQELFKRADSRKLLLERQLFVEKNGSALDLTDRYIARLLPLIDGNGEYEKIMAGCFEVYPTLKFHDTKEFGSNINAMHDHLAFFDRMMNVTYSTENSGAFDMNLYAVYPLLAFHQHCAQTQPLEKIEYPRQDYEFFQLHKTNEHIVDTMFEHLDARQREWISNKKSVVLEVISPLLRILSPSIKTVNAQLLKGDEKARVQKLVSVMVSLGLTYIQHKQEEGKYTYDLEPPIEKVIEYCTHLMKTKVLPGAYTVRQLIAHEVSQETMRRHEQSIARRFGSDTTEKVEPKQIIATHHVTKTVAKDFFGRPVSDENQPERANQKEKEKAKLSFKYHEGYSNAVRKKVLMRDVMAPNASQ